MGARIGVDRRQFLPEYFALPDLNAVVDEAIDAMADAGAEIVDPVDPGDPFTWFDAEFLVLLNEFKGDIRAYLSGLRKTSMRTLSDLIAFNREHCEQEMRFFGQEIFEISDSLSGDLDDPDYLAARALCLELGRDQGIDAALARDDLDAIVSPSYAFGTSGPAVAGYPLLSVPVGISCEGRPAGIWLSGGFLSEPKLLGIGYALEQLLDARSKPAFAGTRPADPPTRASATVSTPHACRGRRAPSAGPPGGCSEARAPARRSDGRRRQGGQPRYSSSASTTSVCCSSASASGASPTVAGSSPPTWSSGAACSIASASGTSAGRDSGTAGSVVSVSSSAG